MWLKHLALVAIFLSGCGGAGGEIPSEPPPRLSDVGAFAPGFVSREDCRPLGRYDPPAVGTVYRYRNQDGAPLAQAIDAVSGDVVTSVYRALDPVTLRPSPATTPMDRQTTFGGMAPAGLEGATRRIAYDRPVMSAVAALEPRQAVSVQATETTTFGGRAMSLNLPLLFRYEACGTLTVGAMVAPVRVYRVSSAGRSRTRDGAEAVRRSETVFYLSNDDGWPLAYQGRTLTMIEAVERPAS